MELVRKGGLILLDDVRITLCVGETVYHVMCQVCFDMTRLWTLWGKRCLTWWGVFRFANENCSSGDRTYIEKRYSKMFTTFKFFSATPLWICFQAIFKQELPYKWINSLAVVISSVDYPSCTVSQNVLFTCVNTCKLKHSLVLMYNLLFWSQTLWEGYVCDPNINKDGRTWEVEPLDYQRDSIELYKYHLQSIYKRIAVHMHALNKKVAKDPRVLVNILPIGSGLTIATKLWLNNYSWGSVLVHQLFFPCSTIVIF